jgi:hypothetical protein
MRRDHQQTMLSPSRMKAMAVEIVMRRRGGDRRDFLSEDAVLLSPAHRQSARGLEVVEADDDVDPVIGGASGISTR